MGRVCTPGGPHVLESQGLIAFTSLEVNMREVGVRKGERSNTFIKRRKKHLGE